MHTLTENHSNHHMKMNRLQVFNDYWMETISAFGKRNVMNFWKNGKWKMIKSLKRNVKGPNREQINESRLRWKQKKWIVMGNAVMDMSKRRIWLNSTKTISFIIQSLNHWFSSENLQIKYFENLNKTQSRWNRNAWITRETDTFFPVLVYVGNDCINSRIEIAFLNLIWLKKW